MKTISKPATKLAVGDTVYQHGGLFKVVRVVQSVGEFGPVHANITEFLGNAPGTTCAVPEHWRDGWNVQGNERHIVAIVQPE